MSFILKISRLVNSHSHLIKPKTARTAANLSWEITKFKLHCLLFISTS